jgi:small-conductance mechanosensitive channel
MGLEGEMEPITRLGELIILHGQRVVFSLAFLVAGLLAAKIAVRYLKRILVRFMANKAMVATIANLVFVLLAVIVFVIALEQAGVRSVVINRILAAAALVITAILFLIRPLIPSLPFKVGNTKYWTVRCALLEKVKLRFDQEGIVIPFPQRDVHLHEVASGPEAQMVPHDEAAV